MATLSVFIISNRLIQLQMEQRQLQNLESSIMTGNDFISLRTRGDRYFETGFYNAAEAAYNQALILASNEDNTDNIIERLSIIYIGSQAAVEAYLSGVSAEAILNNPEQFVDQCGASEGDNTDAAGNNNGESCGCEGGVDENNE